MHASRPARGVSLLFDSRTCVLSGHRAVASLLGLAVALALVLGGICAPGAAAKRKATKAAPAAAGQLRGVNLTPNWEWPGSRGMDEAASGREIQSACDLGANLVRFTV